MKQSTITPTTGRNRGFTLVELLVVVAVIGILIGVLLPALAGARESGQRLQSANNIRQIVLIKTLYANDNENEFPIIMTRWRDSDVNGTRADSLRRPPRQVYFDGYQANYGGYAGFFSLAQENVPDGLPNPIQYTRERTAVWNRNKKQWVDVEDKREGILAKYFDSGGEYSMLQNPADQQDGESAFATLGMPPVVPTEIRDLEDIYWGNISYLYITGLTSEAPALGLVGDETNHPDAGRPDGYERPIADSLTNGTLRHRAENVNERGYTDADNHGDSGGNWGYTDGSVRWEPQLLTGTGDNIGQDPHDKIFNEINRYLEKDGLSGATFTETVD